LTDLGEEMGGILVKQKMLDRRCRRAAGVAGFALTPDWRTLVFHRSGGGVDVMWQFR